MSLSTMDAIQTTSIHYVINGDGASVKIPFFKVSQDIGDLTKTIVEKEELESLIWRPSDITLWKISSQHLKARNCKNIDTVGERLESFELVSEIWRDEISNKQPLCLFMQVSTGKWTTTSSTSKLPPRIPRHIEEIPGKSLFSCARISQEYPYLSFIVALIGSDFVDHEAVFRLHNYLWAKGNIDYLISSQFIEVPPFDLEDMTTTKVNVKCTCYDMSRIKDYEDNTVYPKMLFVREEYRLLDASIKKATDDNNHISVLVTGHPGIGMLSNPCTSITWLIGCSSRQVHVLDPLLAPAIVGGQAHPFDSKPETAVLVRRIGRILCI